VIRSEIMVRMGELAASADTSDLLVSLALGSCVGVAMVDRRRTLAGLAHVMLPEAPTATTDVARFADTAVPELLRRMIELGAMRNRLEVSIVGGAQMFTLASDATAVGRRNEAGVRDSLRRLRLPISSACTGGRAGRTVRVDVATGEVFVKEAGGKPFLLEPGTVTTS
jgi:chemotaxis protein CheD